MVRIQTPYGLVLFIEGRGGRVTSSDFPNEPKFEMIERIVLAHAIAGVDVGGVSYSEGIQTVVDALLNEE